MCAVQFDVENYRKELNKINKQIAQLKLVSSLNILFLFLFFVLLNPLYFCFWYADC